MTEPKTPKEKQREIDRRTRERRHLEATGQDVPPELQRKNLARVPTQEEANQRREKKLQQQRESTKRKWEEKHPGATYQPRKRKKELRADAEAPKRELKERLQGAGHAGPSQSGPPLQYQQSAQGYPVPGQGSSSSRLGLSQDPFEAFRGSVTTPGPEEQEIFRRRDQLRESLTPDFDKAWEKWQRNHPQRDDDHDRGR